jgi:hypothetical protein
MKTKLFVVVLTLVFAAVTFSAFGEDAAKSSGIAEDLASKLSLKPEQAVGAAGSIFSLAKSKLSAEDFGKIAAKVPEMENLLKAVPTTASDAGSSTSSAVSALMESQGGAAKLMSQFQKLGISPATAAKVVPEALQFVKSKQGEEVMNLLSKAIK